MPEHRIYSTPFSSVYPHYIAKAEKKGRTKAEVDEIILWLTGYTAREFAKHLKDGTDFEAFYGQARLNPARRGLLSVGSQPTSTLSLTTPPNLP